MRAQVITTCDYLGGSLQHALTLAKCLTKLPAAVQVVNVRPPCARWVEEFLAKNEIGLEETTSFEVPAADLSLVVDLYEAPCQRAARLVMEQDRRVILVPTGYLHDNHASSYPARAEQIWFVSWDQAIHAQPYWALASRVECVHCAVDQERFHPLESRPNGRPRRICRHSRDTPEKFTGDMGLIFAELARSHDVEFRILGGTETLGHVDDKRIGVFAQGSIDPARFLQEADLWLFAHASYWRESACIAMLEAMSCGLPVLVSNSGGMREYMAHGRTGFSCDNAAEFVGFCRVLLDNEQLYCDMAAAGPKFVAENFSEDRLAHRVKELLA
jgi:glycosyltransferase involved in cell wall biosynthesis